MQLKFTSLDYQTKASDSIVKVFDGCEFKEQGKKGDLLNQHTNPILQPDFQQLKSRIEKIRICNKTADYGKVVCSHSSPINLDVLMETGTGKTFTFIETIYKLNANYNLAKFIILVPSNAIRLGAIKNLEITKDYFKSNYDNKNLSIINYSSQNVGGFITNTNKNISVLVTTFASFNKITNTIHKQKLEQSLMGNAKSYIDALATIKPVIIIDEPHRAGGEKTQKFLPKFKAQIILRFGATFKNDYQNLIYALDSATAFKDNLVKSITVSSPEIVNHESERLEFISISGRSNSYVAAVNFFEGSQKTKISLKVGDNLGVKLERIRFDSHIVEKITKQEIVFDNGFKLLYQVGEDCSELKSEVQEKMLAEAISLHFEKEEDLFKRDIKALSLFFIDSVNSYLKDDNSKGSLAVLFEKLYKAELQSVLAKPELDENYRSFLESTANEIAKVHSGYFAKSNRDKDNQEQIDLILREKEKLLSFQTPLRFIFSKWALQEGWDNPNIFTLTKLAPSSSTITKLQQIGRGLRLPVNQDGNRITAEENSDFEEIATLNVVIAQAEEDFVEGIQSDIAENSLKIKLEFNEEYLMELEIAENKVEAIQIILKLKELKVIEADDNFNCKVTITKDEFDNKKSEIIKELNTILSDEKTGKMIGNLEQIYEVKGKVRNKIEKKQAIINKELYEKFKEMWAIINSKTRFYYNINSETLIENIAVAINKMNIKPPEITIKTHKKVEIKDSNFEYTDSQKLLSSGITLGEFLDKLSRQTKLTQSTLLKILSSTNEVKFKEIAKNSKMAIAKISAKCNQEIHRLQVQNISFEVVEQTISNTELTDEKGEVVNSIDVGKLGKNTLDITELGSKNKSLYENRIGYDSELEKKVIKKETNNNAIEVFAKLPSIKIPTPMGKYNPDFAFVVKAGDKKKLYLVVETKGYDDEKDISDPEKAKIAVGKKFFEALQLEHPDLDIKFKTKLNKPDLHQLISDCYNEDKT